MGIVPIANILEINLNHAIHKKRVDLAFYLLGVFDPLFSKGIK